MNPKAQPNRTTVWTNGRRYDVVWDTQGVLGIEYNNAVMGTRRLFMDGEKAKFVLKKFNELRMQIDGREVPVSTSTV